MSALLTSLPGDIPGLLRAYSPVLLDGTAQAVRALEYASDGTLYARLFGWGRPFHEREVALNLTDPTGRAHAAWWLTGRLDQHPGDEVWQAICRATTGIDMTPTQIDTLARLVLRLAGRAA